MGLLVVGPQPDVIRNVGTSRNVLDEIANDFMKIFPEGDAPMIKRVNWQGPSSGVEKAVMYRDSSERVS